MMVEKPSLFAYGSQQAICWRGPNGRMKSKLLKVKPKAKKRGGTVQITFIFIDFRVCDFAFTFKTQNAPCVSRFKRVLLSDRFQFAF